MFGLEFDLLTILTIISVCIVAAAFLVAFIAPASTSVPEPVRPHLLESTVA
jgi:hypothetical protein